MYSFAHNAFNTFYLRDEKYRISVMIDTYVHFFYGP